MSPKRGIQFRELRARPSDLFGPLVASNRIWSGGMLAAGAATWNPPSANFIFAHPLAVPRNLKVDAIAVEVNTAQASSNVRAGIWEASDADGFPKALVVESASFDTSTTGTKTTAITVTLQGPRLYWVGVVTNDATIGLEASTKATGFNLGYTTVGTNNTSNAIQISHTFGALPDPFGTYSFDDTADDIPRVYLTVV